MTLDAPAIGHARAGEPTARVSAWLRGISLRQIRLATGLVMFAYILSHYFNHALGNISYTAMQSWLP